MKRPRNRVRASLAALQWAANGAGHSYGMFTQRLTAEDEVRIQELDEAWRCDELEYEKEKRLD